MFGLPLIYSPFITFLGISPTYNWGFCWGYNPLIRSPLIRSLPSRDIQEHRTFLTFFERKSTGNSHNIAPIFHPGWLEDDSAFLFGTNCRCSGGELLVLGKSSMVFFFSTVFFWGNCRPRTLGKMFTHFDGAHIFQRG